eukprot:973149_1
MADKIYSAEQITVPKELPQILKGFSKEVIRYNPTDIPQFAIEYFQAMKENKLDQFLRTKEDEPVLFAFSELYLYCTITVMCSISYSKQKKHSLRSNHLRHLFHHKIR